MVMQEAKAWGLSQWDALDGLAATRRYGDMRVSYEMIRLIPRGKQVINIQ